MVCYKTAYHADPQYAKDPAEVTSDWRDAPDSNPESTLIGTIYEGYPVDASFVVSSRGQLGLQGHRACPRALLPAPGRRRIRPG